MAESHARFVFAKDHVQSPMAHILDRPMASHRVSKLFDSHRETTDVDLLQGIPVGLAFGSVPFLLKAKLSYGQVGVFSLASYPYSLKLLWSPIVDAIYNRRMGRRKSWIVPIQCCSGLLLLWLGSYIEGFMENVVLFFGV